MKEVAFVRLLTKKSLQKWIRFPFKESYYSISHKDVIRGMHFQTPPHEHTKLVYVSQGAILMLYLICVNSSYYGQCTYFELNAGDGIVFIFR